MKMHPNLFSLGMIGFYMLASTLLTTPAKHHNPKFSKNPVQSQALIAPGTIINWSNPLMLIKNKAIFPPASKQAIHPDFWSNPVEVLAKGNFLFAPNITATKSDFLFTDNGAVGATPGDVIEYTIIITNSGAMDATGVSFTDQIDPNTTLVPGSDNASPLARDDSYSAIGNVGINVNTIVGGLLGNDEDPDADALTVTAVNTAGTQGTVAFNGDGTFTFTPTAGFEGNTTFTYTISDGTVTDVATVTISVNGMIWFINNASVAGTEDGRLNTPYKSIANFQAVNNGTGSNPAAGDVIFIHQGSGNYTGPLTLLNTQKLIGEGASATLASITGFTVPPFSNPLPTTTLANKPVITAAGTNHAITLGQNNLIRGLIVGNTADGAKIFGNDFGTATIGNVTTPDVMLNGTGKALDLTTGTLAAYFAELTSTSSPTTGVSLTTVAGTLSSLSTTGGISGSTGIGFSVNGSNPTITYAAPISKNSSGKVIDISNTTGNTISFTNTVTATSLSSGINLNTVNGNVTFSTLNLGTSVTRLSAGPAINIVNGTGTYNLGTIAVFTNGITALSASGADGTLNITTGTIDATSGTAVSIDGPGGLTTLGISLEKVSSTNATNGIFIQDTNGSFTVTGNTMTNADGSGGAISGISQRGVSLSNALNISLSNMTITNMTGDAGGAGTCDATTSVGCFGAVHMNNVTTVSLTNVDISTSNEQGIVGNEVSGLTITNSTVDNIGNGIAGGDPNECAVYLRDLKGTCSITNSNFTNADTRLFHLINSSETLNLTINNCDFTDLKTAGQGEDALEMQFLNACNTTLSITNSEFRRYRTYGIQIQTLNTSTTTATITNNQVLQDAGIPGQGIELTGSGTSSVNYTVNNNTVNYRNGNGIGILTIADATSNGKIIGNTITGPGGGVAGIAIRVGATDDSDGINLTQDNIINNYGFNNAIYAFATKVEALSGGTATLNTTIDNNTINAVSDGGAMPVAILVQSGASGTEATTVCANVKNNDVTLTGNVDAFRARVAASGSVLNLAENLGNITILSYWTGKGNTPNDVNALTDSQVSGGIRNFVMGTCPTPPPLMENPVVMLNPPATDPKPVEAAPLEVVETPAPADIEVITDTNVPTASAKADKGGNPPVQKSLLSGETVTINGSGSGFTLKPGESTTIKFRVTINAAPHTNANCQISNQGMVSGNFTTVMTDDPDTGAPNDATLTPLVPPTANFSGTPLTGCVPLQVSFTDASTSNGGTITSWAWDIDNNGSTDYTTQNPMHTYTAPGIYTVKLTVTDNLGCTDTEIKTNYVNAAEPVVNIAVAPTPVAENSGTAMVFTVTRTGSTDCELTIPFTITGTAVEGTDYPDVVPTSFTIPAGMTTAMLSITPTDDNIVEANETIIITLTDGSNYSVGANNSATGTITNDDQAVISIAATTQAAEDATDGLFTITSTKAFDADVTVNFMVTGTASSGTDYTSIGTSVVLPANMTTVTIPVDVLLDAIVEADETVIVTLTSVSNAAGSVAMPINNSATVTITDNDAATISFTAVPSQNEGDVGMSGFNFDVTLGAVVDDAVTVTFATMDGTATIADLDYQTNTNTITFPANGAGQTQTITIQVNGDTDSEQDETFKVMLSNIVVGTGRDVTFAGGGATLSGTGTILNDDQPPFIINEVDADNPGTDNAEFIELYDGGTGNTPLDGLVLVLFNGSDDLSYRAIDLDGFTTDANGYFVIGNAGVAGVDVTFPDGTLQDGADAVALYMANATDFPNGTAITTTNLFDAIVYDANADSDDAGLLVLLNAAQSQVDEDGNGSPECHSLQRIPNGSGGARNTGSYVAVPPTPGAANAVPEVTISVSSNVLEDGATNLTYTITRTGSTCSALSVPFTVTGTADGSDYTINVTSPINIPAGMSSATITVDPTTDGTVEPNETVIITLTDASASNAYNLGTPAAATGTINNDDATTVVSIVRADPNPTNAASVDWTVTFSSPMTGVSASNFTLVPGGSVAGATITNVMGSGTTWTVTASTGTGDGTLGLNMTNSTGATDAAGNGPTNLTFVGEVYDIDKTAPTVTIDQAAGQVDPTNTSPIVFTVQFSEAVTDFDDASDITLSGTAGATTVVIIPVDADTYTVEVSGMTSDGTVIATVIANAAVDAANNGNPASTSTDNTVTYDNTKPTVTINQAAGQVDPTNTSPIVFTVQFSEDVTDFDDASDVLLSGTAGATTVVITPVDADTYTVEVSGMTGTGTVVASIPANAAMDGAGNLSEASTSTDNMVIYVQCPAVTRLYVDADAAGANNGTTWANAFTKLQDALLHACNCPGITEVWVAEGTYYPDEGIARTNDDINNSFQLCADVAVYGGFVGGETLLSERNVLTNKAILSGDIQQNDTDANNDDIIAVADVVGDNTKHVVTSIGTNMNTRLDGFIITAGRSSGNNFNTDIGGGMFNQGGTLTVANCTFIGNYAKDGGGMFNRNSTPLVVNCSFLGNAAASDGGGMYNDFVSPTILNCIFSGNTAGFDGGGLFNRSCSPAVTNCTFFANHAVNRGGAVGAISLSSPTITNSIFFGNTAGIEAPVLDHTGSGSNPTISYSLVDVADCAAANFTANGAVGTCGAGMKYSSNPQFVDADGADNIVGTIDDNLRLQITSPAINMGNDAAVPADSKDVDDDANTAEATPDLDLNNRLFGGTAPNMVDLGAYEFSCAAEAGQIANSLSSNSLIICESTDPGFTFSAENEVTDPTYLYAFLLANGSGTILQNNTTGDFDLAALAAGTYTVYGLSYADFNTPNTLAAYLTGKTISAIQTDDAGTVFCLELTNTPVNGQTVTITVNPKPVGSNGTAMTCSDVALNVDLQARITNGLTSSFTWTVADNPNVTGEANGSGDFITQTLTNTSGSDQQVIYTVTPTDEANDCDGNTFTITVTIKSEPLGSNGTAMTCSDVALNVDLQSRITNGQTSSFTWTIVDNPNVTGEANGSGDFITQTLTNTSGIDQQVVYTVTPTDEANNCVGNTFTVTVTVQSEPVGSNGTALTCSDDALNVNLQNQITNGMTNVTFTYTVSSSNPGNVPAAPNRTTASAAPITDTYVNNTGQDVTITYTVTPIGSNGCTGNTFTITVTVDGLTPGTVGNNQTVCVTKKPATLTTITAASSSATITYKWEMSTEGCDGTFTEITDGVESDTAENLVFTKPLKKTTTFRRRAFSTRDGLQCEAVSNCVTITVLNVDCGQFPWNGN